MASREIIIVTTTLGNDGAERILTELSNEWVRTGNQVTVVQTHPSVDESAYASDDRVEKIDIRVPRKNGVQWYLDEIKEVVKLLKTRPDAVVLAFLSRSFYIVSIASFFVKNKIVFSERNDPSRWPAKKSHRILRNLAFLRADACVFQTAEAMSYFPKIVQKKGVIIPNPCNPNLPQRYRGTRRKAIVSASRLTKQKNLPMLIRAFFKFHKEFPEYQLEIYGEGEERETLESTVHSLGLDEFVSLPGFAKNIHEIMVDCAMYVCSSDYEGISNSMLEALGMGVPVISTDCPVGGAREMIQSGINGLLVHVGDEETLYESMKLLASDSALAEKLSMNACAIRENYHIARIASKWLDVFQESTKK